MTAHNVIALDVSVPQAVVPQSGDTYNFPRDATVAGNVKVTGSGTNNGSLTVNPISSTGYTASVQSYGNTSLGITSGNTFYSQLFFGDHASTADGRIIYDRSAQSLSIVTASTNALTLDSSQNATFAGDVVIGTSGKGIDYSAAGGSILDQYKEGTFTASLNGSTGGTPVTTTGYYTKIGDMYHVEIDFTNANTTGMTGNIQVTGFPEASSGNAYGSAWSHQIAGSSITNGFIPRLSSGTTINFITNDSTSFVTISAGTGRYLRLTIDYKV